MDDIQLFLSKIPVNGTIGNTSLRKILNWEEDRYKQIRDELIKKGICLPGKGKGGSVKLANLPETKKIHFSLELDPLVVNKRIEKIAQEEASQEGTYHIPNELSEDEQKLFDLIPPEEKINNNLLISKLGWSREHFNHIRNFLLARKLLISVAGGIAGASKKPNEEELEKLALKELREKPFDFSPFATDADALLSLVTPRISNTKAKTQLGFDENRYNAAKEHLLVNKKIKNTSGGQTGSIRLYTPEDDITKEKIEKTPESIFDDSIFASPEEAMLSLIPVSGHIATLKLYKTLSIWDKEKIAHTKTNLIQTDKIVTERSVIRRFRRGDTKYEEPEKVERQEETSSTPLDKNIAIYSCQSLELANQVISKLKTKGYIHQEFFTEQDDFNSFVVKMKRRYPVPMSRNTYELLCKKAEEAAEASKNNLAE
jgi:hypothetical protein